ncbi:MAG: glycosyltransferase family 2 protein, partial [Elusimicrobia bacterium]|nr:glycosyltransferase family 2 protein [Elusimicrobiota bacterium]
EKNSDDFVFDQQFLIQAAYLKQRLGDVPVAARYFAEASSINFRRSCVYGLEALWCLGQFVLQRWGIVHFDLFVPKTPR